MAEADSTVRGIQPGRSGEYLMPGTVLPCNRSFSFRRFEALPASAKIGKMVRRGRVARVEKRRWWREARGEKEDLSSVSGR